MAMRSAPTARVTATRNTMKTPILIEKEFDEYDEAWRYYCLLVGSDDSYDNICLWRNDGWWLAEHTY